MIGTYTPALLQEQALWMEEIHRTSEGARVAVARLVTAFYAPAPASAERTRSRRHRAGSRRTKRYAWVPR